MGMGYDFTDHEIRNMVMRDHQPTENWQDVQAGYEAGDRIMCQADALQWPCPVIKSLREYDREQLKAHHRKMAEQEHGSIFEW